MAETGPSLESMQNLAIEQLVRTFHDFAFAHLNRAIGQALSPAVGERPQKLVRNRFGHLIVRMSMSFPILSREEFKWDYVNHMMVATQQISR